MRDNCSEDMSLKKAKRICVVVILLVIVAFTVRPILEIKTGFAASFALPVIVSIVGLAVVLYLRSKVGPF